MKLKVVCLNLWNGGRLMDQALDFLKSQDADIVFLQEVYDGRDDHLERRFRSMQVLQEELGYPHAAFAKAMLDKLPEGDILEGNAILSRYPLQPQETLFFNEPFHELTSADSTTFKTMPRILQHAVCVAPDDDLELFNVHGVWDLDGDNFGERRRKMRDSILKATAGKQHVIMAGDTNAQPTNEMWVEVDKQLKSVFGTELTSTFNMKHKTNPGYATARVDMMHVSPSIKVLEKECPAVDVSDHLPLVAVLEVNP